MTTPSPDHGSVALVLGSGGILGGAFHAGVLKALLDARGIDARDVDLVVGTSAGSVAGSLIAAGLHPNDLFRRETGQPLSPHGQRIMAAGRARRGPRPTTRTQMGRPAAPEILTHYAFQPWAISPGSVAAALLPRGGVPTSHIGDVVDGVLDGAWPDRPDLRVCAVEVSTGRRVVFDSKGAAGPGEAVAASCSVPAVYEPVRIEGRDYFDGGVHSADNLDVLGPRTYDLVVVSSPMSTADVSGAFGPWGLLRAATRWQTEMERQALARCRNVEIVRPARKDRDAMGQNLLDVRRRPAVALQAHATACQLLQRQAA